MKLRDYQEEIKGRVYAAWEAGCRSVMCQMPTGTGKTVVLSQVINDALALSEERRVKSEEFKLDCSARVMKVLVVAHRKEILEQIRETLCRYGLGERLADGSIVVESIQKLSRTIAVNSEQLTVNNGFAVNNEDVSPSLVIIDEAHHCTAKTYRMLWEAFPGARFLGMTATPCRLKQEGFEDLFDRLVCSYSVKQFIDKGWLADYDYVVIRPDGEMKRRIDSLKKRGVDGDYQQKELGTVMDNRACIEQLFESYRKYAEGRQGIIYAINKEHAGHIADYYAVNSEQLTVNNGGFAVNSEQLTVNNGGFAVNNEQLTVNNGGFAVNNEQLTVNNGLLTRNEGNLDKNTNNPKPTTQNRKQIVVVVDSATPKKERERINKEYREGKIRILVNCDIYSEGVDMPDCSFIQLARPTLSLSKYIQQVGRGLRPNKDGSHTLILDNVGMYYLFGLPDAERDWQKMFREGQVAVNSEQLTVNNGGFAVNSEQLTVNNGFCHSHKKTGSNVDGHNLDMYVVDTISRKGQVEIIQTKHKGVYYYTFARKGEIIDKNLLFSECSDFVYGFCWMQYYKEEPEKHFFDDCGNYIVSLPGDCVIRNSGFVCIRKKGFASYYDLKMKVHMTCLPDVFEYGDAEFVKIDGSLHLRNAEYGSIGFKKSSIKEKDDYVLAIDKSKGESYVIQDEGRVVYRVLGEENNLTTILWDTRYANTLHKLQCGMITIIKQSEEPELYEKWWGVRGDLSEIEKLDGEKTYFTEGDTPSLLEKDGLYGWYHGNKVRCKAKFKEILDSTHYMFYLLVINKKDRKILVDNYGYTLYDRYEIDKLDDYKLLLMPNNEIEGCLNHSIDKVYVDAVEFLSKSQDEISEIVEYKHFTFRVRNEGNGSAYVSPDDEELRHIHLTNLEDKRYYLLFTDGKDQNGRKIIYAKGEYYYVTEMHSEKFMYIENVKTHKKYAYAYSNNSYKFKLRELKENGGWNVQKPNDGSEGGANESIKKFLQRYSKVK